MSAEDDAVCGGDPGGVAHRVVIAGMAAARHIRGVDQRPQLALDRATGILRRFAEVTTELDHGGG